MKKHININRQLRRKYRVSKNIIGTKERPRVSVFRSNKYIYVQVIDDEKRQTITSYCSLKIKEKNNKTDQAFLVGQKLAKLLKEKGIVMGIFDRGRYSYNGRVKALADGLRKEDLII